MNSHENSGFTLLELLIATALGLFLLSGLIPVVISHIQTFRFQSELARLQENGRYALFFLAEESRMAGYPGDDFSGAPLAGTNNDGENESDSITISYEGDQDCLGNGVATVQNRYYVEDGNLKCDGNGGTPQPLFEGVETLQILYGEDTGTDGLANRYRSADELSEMTTVVTLRIAFLIRSIEEVRATPDTNNYDLIGTIYDPPDDRHLRWVLVTTVQLRNR